MTSSVAERGQRGVNRVLAKLDSSIAAGNYYEAHQMYRTLYFRYTAQNKFVECLELLFNGTLKLLSKQQETSAADLALLIIDTLEKHGTCRDVEMWMQRFGVLIARLSPTTVERETLINRSIKWSAEISGYSLGNPTMHKLIAQVLSSEGSIEQARHHYLLCHDGVLCGRILIKMQELKGYANEIDLFIVQAVLQQLCLNERRIAESTFVTYIENHPKIGKREPVFKQPLLNFIYFLFRCIDRKRLDNFQALCDAYRPSLNRDLSFEKYLLKISVLFLGAKPPAAAGGGMMGGMFGDLFSRLFQGFDDDDEEQAAETRAGGDASGTSQASELD